MVGSKIATRRQRIPAEQYAHSQLKEFSLQARTGCYHRIGKLLQFHITHVSNQSRTEREFRTLMTDYSKGGVVKKDIQCSNNALINR